MRRIAALFALPLLLLVSWSGTATAATSKASYDWHVADQFLHDAVGSPLGAIAPARKAATPSRWRAPVNSTSRPRRPAAPAPWCTRMPPGRVLATGAFTANRLISFTFYGCGIPGLPGTENLCGGLAKLDVTAHPSGSSLHLPATPWIDCLIGNFPPSGVEGVRLNVKDLINFNKSLTEEEGSGFTVFVQH